MKKIIALLICSFILVAVSGSATETIFTFDVVNTQTISGVVSTTEQITIDWGDESSGNYNGIDQNYSKDYGSAGNRTVTITATDESCLTKFTMIQEGANVSFSLSDLPSGLTYFYCIGKNTVSGSLFDLPSDLTHFRCQGSNTVSGSLSDLPSGLAYFYCTGLNTVSGYSTKLWTTKPATFVLTPTSGGLSTAEVDQLLIDLDDDLVWGSGNIITLNGTNAPRSATSDAAVASIEGEGAAVTTSNVLQLGNLYQITATEINHFGTGLEVDDYFVSDGTETVNASNKVKQVTDCAATGALIVSALGGATRAWESVDSGFNPNLACTYEIYDVTLTGLADGESDIYIYDSVGAFLKATLKAQGAGETSDSIWADDCADDGTAGWYKTNCAVAFDADHYTYDPSDINNATRNVTSKTTVSGALYKLSVDIGNGTGSTTSMFLSAYYGTGAAISGPNFSTAAGYATVTHYTTATGTSGNWYLRNNTNFADNINFKNVAVTKIKTPSADGVTLQASKWDTTESFGVKTSGFKYNEASYAVRVFKAR